MPALEAGAPGVVLDASVVINLLATGRFADILGAIPMARRVTAQAWGEVCLDPREQPRVRRVGLLDPFLAAGLLTREPLDATMAELFLDLTGAESPNDLGDGESATIAYAAVTGCVAVLDERKAIGLCRRRFPLLPIMTTVDLIRLPEVHAGLGDDGLVEALFAALRFARMSVPQEHRAWVRALLGPERLASCPSARRLL